MFILLKKLLMIYWWCGYHTTLSCTWKLLGPGDHVDQLLIGHAGEQGHHGDLGVGTTQLLTGAQHRGLCTLEQEEYLGKQQSHLFIDKLIKKWSVVVQTYLKQIQTHLDTELSTWSGDMPIIDDFPPPPPAILLVCFLLSWGGAILCSRSLEALSLVPVRRLSRRKTRPRSFRTP